MSIKNLTLTYDEENIYKYKNAIADKIFKDHEIDVDISRDMCSTFIDILDYKSPSELIAVEALVKKFLQEYDGKEINHSHLVDRVIGEFEGEDALIVWMYKKQIIDDVEKRRSLPISIRRELDKVVVDMIYYNDYADEEVMNIVCDFIKYIKSRE